MPYVEVHISSIATRNIHCVLSDAAEGVITGFGMFIDSEHAPLQVADRDAVAEHRGVVLRQGVTQVVISERTSVN